MLIPHAKIISSPGKGAGLFSTERIPAGTVIWCPCTDCEYYEKETLDSCSELLAFKLEEHGYYLQNGDILVPCRHACYMNHSCNANTLDFGLDFGLAVKTIEEGEEILCDYRNWQNDPDWAFDCVCGSPNCAQVISPLKEVKGVLKTEWIDKIQNALVSLNQVEQPLEETLKRCSRHFLMLRENLNLYNPCTTVHVRAPQFLHELQNSC